jgi:hypothetical protein
VNSMVIRCPKCPNRPRMSTQSEILITEFHPGRNA